MRETKSPSLLIRPETAADHQAVFAVNATAFPTDMEARLVDALREAGLVTLSLVAEEEGRIVGNAVYSPMTFDGNDGGLKAVGLGPLAVVPEYQKRGVGSALVLDGIERCRDA